MKDLIEIKMFPVVETAMKKRLLDNSKDGEDTKQKMQRLHNLVIDIMVDAVPKYISDRRIELVEEIPDKNSNYITTLLIDNKLFAKTTTFFRFYENKDREIVISLGYTIETTPDYGKTWKDLESYGSAIVFN